MSERALRLGHRARAGRAAAGAVLRRPRPAGARRRPRPGDPRLAARRAGCRSRRPAPRSCWSGCSATGRLELADRAADAAPGRRHRDHDRHAVVLARGERPAPGARRRRRPAAAAAPRPRADPALDDRPGHHRVRRRLPREAPRAAGRRGRVRRPRPRADRRRALPGGDLARCRASSAASARARPSAPPACSACSARRSCSTTPVQAELAKIWTNILRYATFALPNLLMMDCESYGANVFEVIDLINRDYPRGGIAMPGMTAGTCLRKDFAFSEERSNAPGHAAGRLARERGRAAVPGRGDQAPHRQPRLAQGGGARPDLQARHRRRARLAVAQAHPPARARAGRRRRLRPARRHPDPAARRGGPRRRRGDRGHQPLRFERPETLRQIRALGRRRLPARRSVEQPGHRPGVRLRRRDGRAARRRRRDAAADAAH